MKLIYPACFYPCENSEGYTVEVPDMPGCVTEGKDLAEAMEMAVDAASGWVLDELEDGVQPPAATDRRKVKLERENGFVNLIVLDMDEYAEKYGNKAVRKNCTIPAWMDTMAERYNVNFSAMLQESLEKFLQGKK